MFNFIDPDSFGIICDMLNDEFDFLIYLKKENILPKNKQIDWSTLDWNYLTTNNKRNMKFLREFQDYVNWDIISNNFVFTGDLTYNFFEDFKDKLDWHTISKWNYIAEDFIDMFHKKLDWNVLSSIQFLTPYLIDKYHHKIQSPKK